MLGLSSRPRRKRSPSKPKPKSRKPRKFNFGVKTRIARSTGANGRYAMHAVRVLPAADTEGVVLQATDGRHAVCLLAEGQAPAAHLVPAGVLPTRRLQNDAVVQLVDGQWQSTEGKLAEDEFRRGDEQYPSVGEVLPAVGKRPFYETARKADARRQTDGQAESAHVVFGLDIELLRKTAEALGAGKLTFMVPVPVKQPDSRGPTFVNKPILICPSSNDAGTRGIGVVMPLTPENANGYFARVRDAVIAAERRSSNGNGRDRRGEQSPQERSAE